MTEWKADGRHHILLVMPLFRSEDLLLLIEIPKGTVRNLSFAIALLLGSRCITCGSDEGSSNEWLKAYLSYT